MTVTTISSRVQAGVPSGGQFAATAHSESAVTLDAAPGNSSSDTGYDFDRSRDAVYSGGATEGAAHERQNERIAGHLARVIRQVHPDAAHFTLTSTNVDDPESSYPGLMRLDGVFDKDWEELDTGMDSDSQEIQDAMWEYQVDVNGGLPLYMDVDGPHVDADSPSIDIEQALALPDPRIETPAMVVADIATRRQERLAELQRLLQRVEDSEYEDEYAMDVHETARLECYTQDSEDLTRLLAALDAAQPGRSN